MTKRLLPIESCKECIHRESMNYLYNNVYCSLKLGGLRSYDFYYLWNEYFPYFAVQEYSYACGYIQYHARIKSYHSKNHKIPEWCPLEKEEKND